jgi:hypothetical protein
MFVVVAVFLVVLTFTRSVDLLACKYDCIYSN